MPGRFFSRGGCARLPSPAWPGSSSAAGREPDQALPDRAGQSPVAHASPLAGHDRAPRTPHLIEYVLRIGGTMATSANPRNVEFRLADDGEHVEWRHQCADWGPDDPEPALALLPLGTNGWSIEQREPLTVTPSILCRRCQLHGWITDGHWWNA